MGRIRLIRTGLPDLWPQGFRSSGIDVVHISDIIGSLCVYFGHYKPSETGPDKTRMNLGLALEWAIIQGHHRSDRHRYIVPAELELNGLYGHPDLLDTFDEAIHEFKFTERSSKGSPRGACKVGEIASPDHPIYSQKFERDWWQIKAYCRMMEWYTGRLHLCHSRGDYKSREVIYNTWEQRFTRDELTENWSMLLKHSKTRIFKQYMKQKSLERRNNGDD